MTQGNARPDKFTQMTTSPLRGLILRLAVPSIISMLITSLYNMADTYFVGTLGTSATGAVGVVFSLMSLIQSLGFFFGHGAGNYVSRRLGAQDHDTAARMASTGFYTAWLTGAALMVAGLVLRRPLAQLLGATDTILPYAQEYLFYILLGTPWMVGSLMLNLLLRFQGSAFYGMIGIASGAVLNIVLDPLLIHTAGMGVAGAGLATSISQLVSCVLLFYQCRRGGNIPPCLKNFTPRWAYYREMFRGGTPSLCRQGIASISIILLNHTAGVYGDAAIAALSIVSRVSMFASSALLGFGQGFQPVCGFNYGAKRFDRVREAFWFCVKLSTAVLLVLAVLGAVCAPGIIALFRADDPDVIRIGTLALRLQCIPYPLLGWVFISNMMLQTIGQAGRASVMAAARQGIFLIPMLLILPAVWGLLGLQWCQPAADFGAFLIAVPLTAGALREMKDRTEAMGPAAETGFADSADNTPEK